MFFSWRYQLRKAENAFRSGRLKEAAEKLCEHDLKQYRPGLLLTEKVIDAMGQRSRHYLAADEIEAAWRVLETAVKLLGNAELFQTVRRELIDCQLDEVEAVLEAENFPAALSKIQALEKRQIAKERLRRLKLILRRVESARNLSLRGKFTDAETQLAAAAELQPDLKILSHLRTICHEKIKPFRQLTEQLHCSMTEGNWSTAAAVADELLQLAPQCTLARDARRKAWSHADAPVRDSSGLADTSYWSSPNGGGLATCLPEVETVTDKEAATRFLLWVDAVGGYMVCLNDEVVLGQAVPGSDVDIPLVGDLARRHAKIRRQGEGYIIEPLQPTSIDGKTLVEPTLLKDGEEIELGGCVRLRFRKPHALSASARLDFVSRHRTQPWSDAILLMAESCVLGPNWHNHITCRDWPGDVVLFRDGEQLCCRTMDEIEIDGRLCEGHGQITTQSRIAGGDFSMSLEKI